MWMCASGQSNGKVEWDPKSKKMYIGLGSGAYLWMELDEAEKLHRDLDIEIKLAAVQETKNANE